MQANDLSRLGKRPAFLGQGESTFHEALAYQQFYHSSIPCSQKFWHRFGGQDRAHKG